jgi:hypothetical protein
MQMPTPVATGGSRQLYEVSGDTFCFGLTSTEVAEWVTFLEGEYHRRR